MLRSMETEPVDGVIETSWNAPEWRDAPGMEALRQFRLFFGSPTSGPMLWLMDVPTPMAELLHKHRTDTFRATLGDGPQESIIHDWMDFGDYYVQQANTWYLEKFSETVRKKLFLAFDSRQGVGMVTKEGCPTDSAGFAAAYEMLGAFDDNIPAFHLRDEDAVSGASITHAGTVPRNGYQSSLHDRSGWVRLEDGSEISVVRMGDPEHGTAVVLSRNAPGAVEAPRASFGSDMVRCVVEGSCSVGDRTYGKLDFRATEAGTEEGPVVHGPQGSTQILWIADRGAWRPRVADGADRARLDAVVDLLGAGVPA